MQSLYDILYIRFAMVLNNCVVAIKGTFETGQTHKQIKKIITGLGATSVSSITKKTTHAITTDAYYMRNDKFVEDAKAKFIPIVKIGWLNYCWESKVGAGVDEYTFENDKSDTQTSPKQISPDVIVEKTQASSGNMIDTDYSEYFNTSIPTLTLLQKHFIRYCESFTCDAKERISLRTLSETDKSIDKSIDALEEYGTDEDFLSFADVLRCLSFRAVVFEGMGLE